MAATGGRRGAPAGQRARRPAAGASAGAGAGVGVQLNLNVRGLQPSATVAINERSNRLRAEGREVFKLGLGQSPFPVPRPVIEELRANAHQKDYLPVKGLKALREAVAEHHRRAEGITCSAEDVLVGPGSKELMFLLQLVYYGDLVVPSPSWVSYAPQAHIIGRQIEWLHTRAEDRWKLDAARLGEEWARDPGRPRILVLNYPSNPTGQGYAADELKAIARVARKHRAIVLSDEIYGKLHHRDEHVSIARFYPEGTILSGGLSKWCGAGGWRLGTFAFPRQMRWLLDAMAAVASETYTSTSAPIQFAAIRAFKGGLRIERYLWHVRKILAALGGAIVRRLGAAGVPVDPPDGGFYLFPDLGGHRDRLGARGIATSRELTERLLADTGVAILPGEDFGRAPDELTARIAYVDFDGARALAAAEVRPRDEPLDEAFLQVYCGPVLRAMDRMCDWLEKPARRR